MILTAGKVGLSQSLTLDKQARPCKNSAAVLSKESLLGDEIHFGNVQKNLAEARLRQKNQDQLKEEELALNGYPEYRELMLGKIQLSHNQTMTGMEFLQLIHKEQFYKKFGLKSNLKRGLATALCATVVGPLFYCFIDEMRNGFWSKGGMNDIKRQFNFGVHLPTLRRAIGLQEEYGSVFSKIKYSDLVIENEKLDLIRLTPKGLKVLKNYEAQQKMGLLVPVVQEKTSDLIQADVLHQVDHLAKLTAPVFAEGKEYLTCFQLLKAIQGKQTWFAKQIGRGFSKQDVLKRIGKTSPLSTKEQLAFNHALAVLVELALIKGNTAATHFQLTDAGKALLQSNLNTPNIPLLKETAQTIYTKELDWYSTEKETLFKKLEREMKAHEQIAQEFEKIRQDLQNQYRFCQQLNEKKSTVSVEERPAYLTQVDQAVKQYRELTNKVEFHQTRLLEHEKQYDAMASRQAAHANYLEKQAKTLQQKLWMLESNASVFKPDDAMRDVMALAHQRFLYQNGLVVDLTSSPTDEEVSRILCEVSIEGALEEIVSKPPTVDVPVLTDKGADG
jgi:hypothetical protein